MEYKEAVDALKEMVRLGSNVQLISDYIILAAVLCWTSDIHIEPLSSFVRIRYRQDGELKEILEYQLYLHQSIVARFKILGDLKIDESRVPQDGRISKTIEEKPLDLRISTLPTVNGEKIVMRIVDKSKKIPKLESLWIEGRNGDLVRKAITLPNGIILTSGPTWSWKSTTLYSALNILNKPNVNIMTLEDPVENQVDGLNQSQMRPQIGYTFAAWLRTALRQDPDIIMVWEIRDHETIEIAIEASLTWHLVLSTIHTNSAAETLTRVIQMGIQPFLIPASFNTVIAQRLIRRLCTCKKEIWLHEIDKETLADIQNAIKNTDKKELSWRVSQDILKAPKFYAPVWCEKCEGSWYKWRVGLYEVLDITDGVKAMILASESAFNINKQAIKDGMISLEQDGIIKALNGLTSLAEVYSVAKTQNW